MSTKCLPPYPLQLRSLTGDMTGPHSPMLRHTCLSHPWEGNIDHLFIVTLTG